MKALSIHPVPAMLIFAKEKTIEVRTWKTNYRGDIVICSTNHIIKDTIPGHALCVVTLKDIVPLEKKHAEAAYMDKKDIQPGLFGWIIDNVRYIRPVPVKGKLGLWNYEGELEYLAEPDTDEEDEKIYHEIYEPIFV